MSKRKATEPALTAQEMVERQKTARATASYLNSRMRKHLESQRREQARFQSLWAEGDGECRIIRDGKDLEPV
jgi:hypothetical protein